MADIIVASFDGTNGATSFTDATGNAWTATTGASLNTTTKKYGTASATTTSTPSAKWRCASIPGLAVGVGDFTIEMWVLLTAAVDAAYGGGFGVGKIFGTAPDDVATANYNLRISLSGLNRNSAPNIYIGQSASPYTSDSAEAAATIPTSTWTHLAFQRKANMLEIYINGAKATLAISPVGRSLSLLSTKAALFDERYDPASGGFNFVGLPGFIDDLRFSDFARYTANFTPTGPNTYTPAADLAATPASVATLSTALSVSTPLTATPTGSASITQALLQGAVPLVAQPTGLATLTPDLAQQTRLAGVGQGTASVEAALTSVFLVDLASAPGAQASASATLQTLPLLDAQPTASSSAAAELSLVVPLDARATNVAALPTVPAVDKPLAAAGAATAASTANVLKQATLQAVGTGDAQAQAQVLLACNLTTDAIVRASAAAAVTLQVFMALLAQSRATSSAASQVGIDPAFDVWTRYVVIAADAPGSDNDRLVLVAADLHGVLVEASAYTALVPPGPADAAMPSEAITA